MLALACQRGHLGLVKLLVLTHGADPESYAVRKNEFPVIVRLPLYAAIKSGGSPVGPARESCRAVEILGVFCSLSLFRNVRIFPRSRLLTLPEGFADAWGPVAAGGRHSKGQSPTQILSLTGA